MFNQNHNNNNTHSAASAPLLGAIPEGVWVRSNEEDSAPLTAFADIISGRKKSQHDPNNSSVSDQQSQPNKSFSTSIDLIAPSELVLMGHRASIANSTILAGNKNNDDESRKSSILGGIGLAMSILPPPIQQNANLNSVSAVAAINNSILQQQKKIAWQEKLLTEVDDLVAKNHLYKRRPGLQNATDSQPGLYVRETFKLASHGERMRPWTPLSQFMQKITNSKITNFASAIFVVLFVIRIRKSLLKTEVQERVLGRLKEGEVRRAAKERVLSKKFYGASTRSMGLHLKKQRNAMKEILSDGIQQSQRRLFLTKYDRKATCIHPDDEDIVSDHDNDHDDLEQQQQNQKFSSSASAKKSARLYPAHAHSHRQMRKDDPLNKSEMFHIRVKPKEDHLFDRSKYYSSGNDTNGASSAENFNEKEKMFLRSASFVKVIEGGGAEKSIHLHDSESDAVYGSEVKQHQQNTNQQKRKSSLSIRSAEEDAQIFTIEDISQVASMNEPRQQSTKVFEPTTGADLGQVLFKTNQEQQQDQQKRNNSNNNIEFAEEKATHNKHDEHQHQTTTTKHPTITRKISPIIAATHHENNNNNNNHNNKNPFGNSEFKRREYQSRGRLHSLTTETNLKRLISNLSTVSENEKIRREEEEQNLEQRKTQKEKEQQQQQQLIEVKKNDNDNASVSSTQPSPITKKIDHDPTVPKEKASLVAKASQDKLPMTKNIFLWHFCWRDEAFNPPHTTLPALGTTEAEMMNAAAAAATAGSPNTTTSSEINIAKALRERDATKYVSQVLPSELSVFASTKDVPDLVQDLTALQYCFAAIDYTSTKEQKMIDAGAAMLKRSVNLGTLKTASSSSPTSSSSPQVEIPKSPTSPSSSSPTSGRKYHSARLPPIPTTLAHKRRQAARKEAIIASKTSATFEPFALHFGMEHSNFVRRSIKELSRQIESHRDVYNQKRELLMDKEHYSRRYQSHLQSVDNTVRKKLTDHCDDEIKQYCIDWFNRLKTKVSNTMSGGLNESMKKVFDAFEPVFKSGVLTPQIFERTAVLKLYGRHLLENTWKKKNTGGSNNNNNNNNAGALSIVSGGTGSEPSTEHNKRLGKQNSSTQAQTESNSNSASNTPGKRQTSNLSPIVSILQNNNNNNNNNVATKEPSGLSIATSPATAAISITVPPPIPIPPISIHNNNKSQTQVKSPTTISKRASSLSPAQQSLLEHSNSVAAAANSTTTTALILPRTTHVTIDDGVQLGGGGGTSNNISNNNNAQQQQLQQQQNVNSSSSNNSDPFRMQMFDGLLIAPTNEECVLVDLGAQFLLMRLRGPFGVSQEKAKEIIIRSGANYSLMEAEDVDTIYRHEAKLGRARIQRIGKLDEIIERNNRIERCVEEGRKLAEKRIAERRHLTKIVRQDSSGALSHLRSAVGSGLLANQSVNSSGSFSARAANQQSNNNNSSNALAVSAMGSGYFPSITKSQSSGTFLPSQTAQTARR